MHGTLRRKVDQANNINDYANAYNAMGVNNGVGSVALVPSTLLRLSYSGYHLTLLKCYHDNICDNDACAACSIEHAPSDKTLCLFPCDHTFHKHCVDPWLANALLTMTKLMLFA